MCVCVEKKKNLLYTILRKKKQTIVSLVKYKKDTFYIFIRIFVFTFCKAFNASGKIIADCITRAYCIIYCTIVCPIRILLRVPVYFTTFSITAGCSIISLYLKLHTQDLIVKYEYPGKLSPTKIPSLL